MIYFIYGKDTYSVKKRHKEIVASFISREGGDLNLSELDGVKIDAGQFFSATSAVPFLGEKRMVVVKNMFLANSNNSIKLAIAEGLGNLPDFADVLIVEEGEPDKRESSVKKMTTQKYAEHFDAPSDQDLSNFVKAEADKNGILIGNGAIYKLLLHTGPDYWRVSNELDKLSDFVESEGRKEILIQDIDKNVIAENDSRVFDLTDALGTKDIKKSVKILYKLYRAGEDAGLMFNMIVDQVRKMLIISDLSASKNEAEIAKITGIHPYVVKKLKASQAKFGFDRLRELHRLILGVDTRVKTGQTDFGAAIDMLLIDFCKQ